MAMERNRCSRAALSLLSCLLCSLVSLNDPLNLAYSNPLSSGRWQAKYFLAVKTQFELCIPTCHPVTSLGISFGENTLLYERQAHCWHLAATRLATVGSIEQDDEMMVGPA